MTDRKYNQFEMLDMAKEEEYWEDYFDRLEWSEAFEKGYTKMDFDTWRFCSSMKDKMNDTIS